MIWWYSSASPPSVGGPCGNSSRAKSAASALRPARAIKRIWASFSRSGPYTRTRVSSSWVITWPGWRARKVASTRWASSLFFSRSAKSPSVASPSGEFGSMASSLSTSWRAISGRFLLAHRRAPLSSSASMAGGVLACTPCCPGRQAAASKVREGSQRCARRFTVSIAQ